MRKPWIRLLVFACIAVLCASAPAVAKNKTHAPPGNSGVDEYLEVVPGGGGNRPVRPPTGGSGHALSGKARGALRSYGRDGQSVSRLADSTSDATPSPRKRKSDVSRTLGTEASKPTDRGAFAALKGAFTALGGGFITILIAVLAAGVALTLRRRRRPSSDA